MMTDFEEATIYLAFFTIAFNIWVAIHSYIRTERAERVANRALSISEQANNLSDTANRISLQGLQTESAKFKVEALERIIKDLRVSSNGVDSGDVDRPEMYFKSLSELINSLNRISIDYKNLFINSEIKTLSSSGGNEGYNLLTNYLNWRRAMISMNSTVISEGASDTLRMWNDEAKNCKTAFYQSKKIVLDNTYEALKLMLNELNDTQKIVFSNS